MNRKSEDELDDELEEWEPFLHHRNRAHKKSEVERRHFNHEESDRESEKRKRNKVKRTPDAFD